MLNRRAIIEVWQDRCHIRPRRVVPRVYLKKAKHYIKLVVYLLVGSEYIIIKESLSSIFIPNKSHEFLNGNENLFSGFPQYYV